jgi:hypothetical protein
MALDRTVGHWYVSEGPTADDIARQFLGDWDRSVPLKAPEVTGTVSEAPPGSSAQLHQALYRFANMGGAILLKDELRSLSDQGIANRLQECEAYLLARNANTTVCGLEPIGQ